MSIYVDAYVEAKVNGEWTSIDFWIRYPPGRPLRKNEATEHIVPAVSGGSVVYSTIRNLDDCVPITHSELSETLQGAFRVHPDDESWCLKSLPASWLAVKNLDLPEYSGYLPRQSILNYQSGISNGVLSDYDMLTPAEYRELSSEEQAAYQYYEWTEQWGERDILRRLKNAVQDRMAAYDDHCRLWDTQTKSFQPHQIDWSDVRVIFHMS